jgi:sulfur relay (sulfurtransferase) DsrC/TusE family protein
MYICPKWVSIINKRTHSIPAENLLCHLIAQQENIEVTEEDYKAAVDYYMEYYKSYGQTITEEELVKAVGERLLNEYALFEKVNEFLLENCTVDYKDKE